MSAQIIEFPRRVVADEPSEARDCRNCVNARHGTLTHCTLVGEDILNEEAVARECEAYEPEEP